MAARLAGASEQRVIFRHMLPSFMSHIIASLTLADSGDYSLGNRVELYWAWLARSRH
jgi:ABC-type microcin C transport system permease subunit YejE